MNETPWGGLLLLVLGIWLISMTVVGDLIGRLRSWAEV